MAAGELNEEQRAALALGGNVVLVSAGPGSGKTRLVVAKLAAALREGIAPERVVAITFTVRAAAELRSRLAQELGPAAPLERFAHIGTFHGYAANLLRRRRLAVGLGERVEVLEEGEADLLRTRALRRCLGELPDPILAELAGFSFPDLRSLVVGDLYQPLRTAGQPSPQLPPWREGSGPQGLAGAVAALLERFAADYAALKRPRGLLDFDDLELLALKLLREGGLPEGERPELVVVDEFQDVNRRQWQLLELLAPRQLFAVGDRRQAIYRFRHADPGIMARLEERLAARGAVATLPTNHRARPELVEFVNAAFAQREGFGRLVAFRPAAGERRIELLLCPKNLERRQGLEGALGRAPGFRQAQALAVAGRVAELLGEGVAGEEVAVLVRTRNQLPAYVEALELHGIAVHQGGGFWSDPAVEALLLYLRAAANPRDGIALLGCLASPLGGLRPGDLEGLAGREVGELERELRHLAEGKRPSRLFAAISLGRRLLATDGIAASLEAALPLLPAAGRRPAVGALLEAVRHFERRHGAKVRRFLRYAQTAAAEAEREGSGAEGPAGMVRVLTIHGAKGLEFEVVCLVDLDAPRSRSNVPLALLGEEGFGLVWREEGERQPSPAYQRLAQERDREEQAEEERLLYVALTRAKERLVIAGQLGKEGFVKRLCAAAGVEEPNEGRPQVEGRLASATYLSAVPQPPRRPPASPNEATDGEPTPPAAPRFIASRALSFTQLERARSCPLRFFVEAAIGLEPGGRQAAVGVGSRHLGILFHQLIAEGRQRLEAGELAALFRERFGAEPPPKRVEELGRLLAVARGEGELLGLAGLPIEREVPFSLALPGLAVPVVGVFDLYARSGERAVVVDYKTNRLAGETPDQATANRYALQQLIYGLAALQGGAAEVEVIHWFLHAPTQPVATRYTAAQFEELAAAAIASLEGVLGGEQRPAQAPNRRLCAGCPARGGICPWPVEATAVPPP